MLSSNMFGSFGAGPRNEGQLARSAAERKGDDPVFLTPRSIEDYQASCKKKATPTLNGINNEDFYQTGDNGLP